MHGIPSAATLKTICLLGAFLFSVSGAPAPTGQTDSDEKIQKEKRLRMVETQILGRGVTSKTVLEAMRKVPRHKFVPRSEYRYAYEDGPLPIGHGQTISQPYIVAFMTDVLDPKPTHTVLEVGTGSGYQAAVLAELVSKVYSIEIIKELGDSAKERLAQLGYKNIEVKVADGYYGWEEHAPFDSIIVTCAASQIPPPLIKQLKPDGKMCIPVGTVMGPQYLLLVTKQKDGTVKSKSILPVRFVPLVGHK